MSPTHKKNSGCHPVKGFKLIQKLNVSFTKRGRQSFDRHVFSTFTLELQRTLFTCTGV